MLGGGEAGRRSGGCCQGLVEGGVVPQPKLVGCAETLASDVGIDLGFGWVAGQVCVVSCVCQDIRVLFSTGRQEYQGSSVGVSSMFEVPVVLEYLHYLGPWWMDEHTVSSISTGQERISGHSIGTERDQGRAILTGLQGDSQRMCHTHRLQKIRVELGAQATSRASRLVPLYLLGTDLWVLAVLQAQGVQGRQGKGQGQGGFHVVHEARVDRHVLGDLAGDFVGCHTGFCAPDAPACLAQEIGL